MNEVFRGTVFVMVFCRFSVTVISKKAPRADSRAVLKQNISPRNVFCVLVVQFT